MSASAICVRMDGQIKLFRCLVVRARFARLMLKVERRTTIACAHHLKYSIWTGIRIEYFINTVCIICFFFTWYLTDVSGITETLRLSSLKSLLHWNTHSQIKRIGRVSTSISLSSPFEAKETSHTRSPQRLNSHLTFNHYFSHFWYSDVPYQSQPSPPIFIPVCVRLRNN